MTVPLQYVLAMMRSLFRDEEGLAFTMAWVRHHDRYDDHYVVDPKAGYVAPRSHG